MNDERLTNAMWPARRVAIILTHDTIGDERLCGKVTESLQRLVDQARDLGAGQKEVTSFHDHHTGLKVDVVPLQDYPPVDPEGYTRIKITDQNGVVSYHDIPNGGKQ